MSARVLLAIGCDAYAELKPLKGAEADAAAIYELLIQPEVGDYDVGTSRLLHSPTLQQVRDALAEMLFSDTPLDTVTITFAGHGAMSGGSFYMAMSDSRGNALSATALSLADLFRMIAEAAPRQTYLIIDACQSGGLISDLNVILKSEVMGEFGTPGVTLLATAASNEAAIEVDGHGIGTAALLACIKGDIFLQDSTPALDLVEIGRAVSDRVSAAGAQTPVVWGLNLYGPAGFCKNPHANTGNAPLRSVLVGWPDAGTTAAIRTHLRRLWEPYVTIPTRWEPREFLDAITPLLGDLGYEAEIRIGLARRIADACAAQAWEARDRFREIEVRAACAVALLPFAGDVKVNAHLVTACAEIAALVEQAVQEAITAVDAYPFSLVNGGLGDLYYLPIRITKLLGWAGFAVHAKRAAGQDIGTAGSCLADLCARIFETYSLSLVAMSDAQSPYLLTALTAASLAGFDEQGERLIGHLFSSSVDCGGRVARADIDPSKVLGFLVARTGPIADPSIDLIAQPTELVLVLLRASRLFDLAGEVDTALEALDHLALNAYLPDDFRDFGANHVEGGTNAVFHIGHDIWSVADIEAAWPNHPAPGDPGTAMTALLTCLLFPDRSPWFLMPLPPLVEAQREERVPYEGHRPPEALSARSPEKLLGN
ncbi:MAG: caspase family protein [Sphingomonadaceae bacterium]|nr:caspase family protein [Sphingomonadaceae bacterium]